MRDLLTAERRETGRLAQAGASRGGRTTRGRPPRQQLSLELRTPIPLLPALRRRGGMIEREPKPLFKRSHDALFPRGPSPRHLTTLSVPPLHRRAHHALRRLASRRERSDRAARRRRPALNHFHQNAPAIQSCGVHRVHDRRVARALRFGIGRLAHPLRGFTGAFAVATRRAADSAGLPNFCDSAGRLQRAFAPARNARWRRASATMRAAHRTTPRSRRGASPERHARLVPVRHVGERAGVRGAHVTDQRARQRRICARWSRSTARARPAGPSMPLALREQRPDAAPALRSGRRTPPSRTPRLRSPLHARVHRCGLTTRKPSAFARAAASHTGFVALRRSAVGAQRPAPARSDRAGARTA